eukprot:g3931.t1
MSLSGHENGGGSPAVPLVARLQGMVRKLGDPSKSIRNRALKNLYQKSEISPQHAITASDFIPGAGEIGSSSSSSSSRNALRNLCLVIIDNASPLTSFHPDTIREGKDEQQQQKQDEPDLKQMEICKQALALLYILLKPSPLTNVDKNDIRTLRTVLNSTAFAPLMDQLYLLQTLPPTANGDQETGSLQNDISQLTRNILREIQKAPATSSKTYGPASSSGANSSGISSSANTSFTMTSSEEKSYTYSASDDISVNLPNGLTDNLIDNRDLELERDASPKHGMTNMAWDRYGIEVKTSSTNVVVDQVGEANEDEGGMQEERSTSTSWRSSSMGNTIAGGVTRHETWRAYLVIGSAPIHQALRSGWSFPSVYLSQRDEQNLFAEALQLKMRDPSSLLRVCLRLEDYLLTDYPAEIFLQRSEIFLHLLSVIHSPEHTQAMEERTAVNHENASAVNAGITWKLENHCIDVLGRLFGILSQSFITNHLPGDLAIPHQSSATAHSRSENGREAAGQEDNFTTSVFHRTPSHSREGGSDRYLHDPLVMRYPQPSVMSVTSMGNIEVEGKSNNQDINASSLIGSVTESTPFQLYSRRSIGFSYAAFLVVYNAIARIHREVIELGATTDNKSNTFLVTKLFTLVQNIQHLIINPFHNGSTTKKDYNVGDIARVNALLDLSSGLLLELSKAAGTTNNDPRFTTNEDSFRKTVESVLFENVILGLLEECTKANLTLVEDKNGLTSHSDDATPHHHLRCICIPSFIVRKLENTYVSQSLIVSNEHSSKGNVISSKRKNLLGDLHDVLAQCSSEFLQGYKSLESVMQTDQPVIEALCLQYITRNETDSEGSKTTTTGTGVTRNNGQHRNNTWKNALSYVNRGLELIEITSAQCSEGFKKLIVDTLLVALRERFSEHHQHHNNETTEYGLKLLIRALSMPDMAIVMRRALLRGLRAEQEDLEERPNDDMAERSEYEILLRRVVIHPEILHILLSSTFTNVFSSSANNTNKGADNGDGSSSSRSILPETNDALIQYILLRLSTGYATTRDPTYLLPLCPVIPLLQCYEELQRDKSLVVDSLIRPCMDLSIRLAETMEIDTISTFLPNTITNDDPSGKEKRANLDLISADLSVLLLHRIRPLFHTRKDVREETVRQLRCVEELEEIQQGGGNGDSEISPFNFGVKTAMAYWDKTNTLAASMTKAFPSSQIAFVRKVGGTAIASDPIGTACEEALSLTSHIGKLLRSSHQSKLLQLLQNKNSRNGRSFRPGKNKSRQRILFDIEDVGRLVDLLNASTSSSFSPTSGTNSEILGDYALNNDIKVAALEQLVTLCSNAKVVNGLSGNLYTRLIQLCYTKLALRSSFHGESLPIPANENETMLEHDNASHLLLELYLLRNEQHSLGREEEEEESEEKKEGSDDNQVILHAKVLNFQYTLILLAHTHHPNVLVALRSIAILLRFAFNSTLLRNAWSNAVLPGSKSRRDHGLSQHGPPQFLRLGFCIASETDITEEETPSRGDIAYYPLHHFFHRSFGLCGMVNKCFQSSLEIIRSEWRRHVPHLSNVSPGAMKAVRDAYALSKKAKAAEEEEAAEEEQRNGRQENSSTELNSADIVNRICKCSSNSQLRQTLRDIRNDFDLQKLKTGAMSFEEEDTTENDTNNQEETGVISAAGRPWFEDAFGRFLGSAQVETGNISLSDCATLTEIYRFLNYVVSNGTGNGPEKRIPQVVFLNVFSLIDRCDFMSLLVNFGFKFQINTDDKTFDPSSSEDDSGRELPMVINGIRHGRNSDTKKSPFFIFPDHKNVYYDFNMGNSKKRTTNDPNGFGTDGNSNLAYDSMVGNAHNIAQTLKQRRSLQCAVLSLLHTLCGGESSPDHDGGSSSMEFVQALCGTFLGGSKKPTGASTGETSLIALCIGLLQSRVVHRATKAKAAQLIATIVKNSQRDQDPTTSSSSKNANANGNSRSSTASWLFESLLSTLAMFCLYPQESLEDQHEVVLMQKAGKITRQGGMGAQPSLSPTKILNFNPGLGHFAGRSILHPLLEAVVNAPAPLYNYFDHYGSIRMPSSSSMGARETSPQPTTQRALSWLTTLLVDRESIVRSKAFQITRRLLSILPPPPLSNSTPSSSTFSKSILEFWQDVTAIACRAITSRSECGCVKASAAQFIHALLSFDFIDSSSSKVEGEMGTSSTKTVSVSSSSQETQQSAMLHGIWLDHNGGENSNKSIEECLQGTVARYPTLWSLLLKYEIFTHAAKALRGAHIGASKVNIQSLGVSASSTHHHSSGGDQNDPITSSSSFGPAFYCKLGPQCMEAYSHLWFLLCQRGIISSELDYNTFLTGNLPSPVLDPMTRSFSTQQVQQNNNNIVDTFMKQTYVPMASHCAIPISGLLCRETTKETTTTTTNNKRLTLVAPYLTNSTLRKSYITESWKKRTLEPFFGQQAVLLQLSHLRMLINTKEDHDNMHSSPNTAANNIRQLKSLSQNLHAKREVVSNLLGCIAALHCTSQSIIHSSSTGGYEPQFMNRRKQLAFARTLLLYLNDLLVSQCNDTSHVSAMRILLRNTERSQVIVDAMVPLIRVATVEACQCLSTFMYHLPPVNSTGSADKSKLYLDDLIKAVVTVRAKQLFRTEIEFDNQRISPRGVNNGGTISNDSRRNYQALGGGTVSLTEQSVTNSAVYALLQHPRSCTKTKYACLKQGLLQVTVQALARQTYRIRMDHSSSNLKKKTSSNSRKRLLTKKRSSPLSLSTSSNANNGSTGTISLRRLVVPLEWDEMAIAQALRLIGALAQPCKEEEFNANGEEDDVEPIDLRVHMCKSRLDIHSHMVNLWSIMKPSQLYLQEQWMRVACALATFTRPKSVEEKVSQ